MITLRAFNASDAELLIHYLNEPKVSQYITAAIAQPYTQEDALWWVNTGSCFEYIKAIEYNGIFVGCISATLGEFEYNRSAELGYWLGYDYWNKGIATQAVTLFSQVLFQQTKVTKLFVSVVSQNIASIRVLAKNGFTQEGLLKQASYKNGVYFDECLMAKLKP